MEKALRYIQKFRTTTKVFLITVPLFVVSVIIFSMIVQEQETAVAIYMQAIASGQEMALQDYKTIMPSLVSFGFVFLFFLIGAVSLLVMLIYGIGKSVFRPMQSEFTALAEMFSAIPGAVASQRKNNTVKKTAYKENAPRSYLERQNIR